MQLWAGTVITICTFWATVGLHAATPLAEEVFVTVVAAANVP